MATPCKLEGPLRWLRAVVAGLSLVATLAPAAQAEPVEFGYTGTVITIDPGLAAALPQGSPIELGAHVFITYVFESTTPDSEPKPSEGIYLDAISAFEFVIGGQRFDHVPSGSKNEIDVFVDQLLTIYQPVDSVAASPALPGFTVLEADVIFLAAQFGGPEPPLADDSLPLVQPSPSDPSWGDAKAAIYDDVGTLLIEVQLSSMCEGGCTEQPQLPVGGPLWLVAALAAAGAAGARGHLRRRSRRSRRQV